MGHEDEEDHGAEEADDEAQNAEIGVLLDLVELVHDARGSLSMRAALSTEVGALSRRHGRRNDRIKRAVAGLIGDESALGVGSCDFVEFLYQAPLTIVVGRHECQRHIQHKHRVDGDSISTKHNTCLC